MIQKINYYFRSTVSLMDVTRAFNFIYTNAMSFEVAHFIKQIQFSKLILHFSPFLRIIKLNSMEIPFTGLIVRKTDRI